MDYSRLSRIDTTTSASLTSHIVIADVRGSTAAILDGRFREVNLAGAACVAAIRNVYNPKDVPYVFGGDGATFLVEENELEKCLTILRGVQGIVRDTLSLRLTVGHMSLKEIRENGAEVSYGFVQWAEKDSQPYFRGNGVALAEREIKRLDDIEHSLAAVNVSAANVQGLSCRHLPFKALRGRILSLVVQPFGDAEEIDRVLKEIFQGLSKDGVLERLKPISHENTRRPLVAPTWKTEARVHSKGRGPLSLARALIQGLIENVLGYLLIKFDIPNSILGKPSTYVTKMLQQSDWIKMDGCLRLVIDVTAEEETELLRLLDELSADGKVLYGLYGSDATVMTCHFQSGLNDQHTHFIDGFGGGLTQAAVDLKAKVKAKAGLSRTA